jgi:hypothetical protein
MNNCLSAIFALLLACPKRLVAFPNAFLDLA